MTSRELLIELIDRDEQQPRRDFLDDLLLDLGKNMLAIGQAVPIIVYEVDEAGETRFRVLDGERRWRAAQRVGIKSLTAVVLTEKPSESKLRILQHSIDAHRKSLTPMERSDVLAKIQAENKWTTLELATNLHMSQSQVSKLLAFQKLSHELRERLHRGELDTEKAFILTQEPDPAKQSGLAREAGTLSREQLRSRLKHQAQDVQPTSAARFVMPGGITVAVQGKEVTLSCAVEVLAETVRILKKALAQGLDIKTQVRVMRDQSKALPKSAS